MKAWVLHGAGDLRREEAADPSLRQGEVLVAVRAAGICGSDIPRIYRTGAHIHPLIPGHELSGEARAGAGGRWNGQRVGIFPLIPCGKCRFCRNRQYEMCRNYSYIGSRRDGGFAEYAAVPEWNLLRLPDTVSYEEAALLEPMAVAVHAMRRIEIAPSDTAAVCGLGTIGLSLLMFLMESQRAGEILAIGNKDFQKQAAFRLGLPGECFLDAREKDAGTWLLDQTNGRGADVFFECVGTNETVLLAMKHTAPMGRIVFVGNPHSGMAFSQSEYWNILRNQLTITGTWNSSFTHEDEDDWHYALTRLSKRRICPSGLISHRLPMEELETGLRMMRDKTEEYGKVIGLVKK